MFVAVEVVGPSKRSAISNAFMTVWAVGYMVLAGVAYLFRDRFVFMIVAAAPTALILIPLWYVQFRLRFLCFEKIFRSISKKTFENIKGTHTNYFSSSLYIIN